MPLPPATRKPGPVPRGRAGPVPARPPQHVGASGQGAGKYLTSCSRRLLSYSPRTPFKDKLTEAGVPAALAALIEDAAAPAAVRAGAQATLDAHWRYEGFERNNGSSSESDGEGVDPYVGRE